MIIKLNTTATKYIGQLDFYSINAKEIGGVTVLIYGNVTSVKKTDGASTTVTGTVTVDEGCTLNSVKIEMGGNDITGSCYDPANGNFEIVGITGNVLITANATSNSSSGGDTETTLTWYINPRSEYSVFEGVSNHTSGPFGYASSWALEQLTGKTINRIGLEIVELGSAGISYGLFDTTTNALTKIGTFADNITETGYQIFSIPDLVIPENNIFCLAWRGETDSTWSFNKSPIDDKYKFKSGFANGSAPMAGLSTTALAIELGYEG